MLCASFSALALALSSPPEAPSQELAIMSALPLFWGEGDAADLIRADAGRAPVLAEIETRFRVMAVDYLSPEMLARHRVLMLAQPTALRPEELVALDDWVHGGGRLIAFADPELHWESKLAPGDPRRAPLHSLLGPLLKHWKLGLSSGGGSRAIIEGRSVFSRGLGQWSVEGKECMVSDGGVIARCVIGRGRALLVADADLLNATLWTGESNQNRDSILALLHEIAK